VMIGLVGVALRARQRYFAASSANVPAAAEYR
jgi:hypothetical protein